jgi:hypothetical protein
MLSLGNCRFFGLASIASTWPSTKPETKGGSIHLVLHILVSAGDGVKRPLAVLASGIERGIVEE